MKHLKDKWLWWFLLLYGWEVGMAAFWIVVILDQSHKDFSAAGIALYLILGLCFVAPPILLFLKFSEKFLVAAITSLFFLIAPLFIVATIGDGDSIPIVIQVGLIASVVMGFGIPLYASVIAGLFGSNYFSKKALLICFWVGVAGVILMMGGCTFGGFAASNF